MAGLSVWYDYNDGCYYAKLLLDTKPTLNADETATLIVLEDGSLWKWNGTDWTVLGT
jgi:hypothetical protein